MSRKSFLGVALVAAISLFACTGDSGTGTEVDSSWEKSAATVGPAVYCIGFMDEDEFIEIGTGFAIGENTIATNAHVVLAMAEVLMGYSDQVEMVAVRNGGIVGGTGFFELGSFAVHPGYNDTTTNTYDFGLVTTKTKMPSWLEFESSANLKTLAVGMEVATIGFPGELSIAYAENPIATFKNGTISALRALNGAVTTSTNGYFIQHNLNLSPGTSGSPIFNRDGKVVAVNNSGYSIYVLTWDFEEGEEVWDRIPIAGLGFGIRGDRFGPTLTAQRTSFSSLEYDPDYWENQGLGKQRRVIVSKR
jgi:S1-C subfamily serine protease